VKFDEALAWLYATEKFGIKLGLENTRRLLQAAGSPERGLRILHVAGTNGKGSVCAMCELTLRASGFRTGLYTSPHLVDFRERIRIDGQLVSPDAVAEGLTLLREVSSDWDHSPTFFEISTVLALKCFAQEGCDFVVLETGMGGRLDATNATQPSVSVITPIAMDHAEWLGDTIEKVASEKAGIIKPDVPVVSARQKPPAEAILRSRAAETGSPISFVGSPWPGPVGLAGSHQHENAALAVAALRACGADCTDQAIADGLRNVQWPGRFQRIGPRMILDGAHNPHAAATLRETWRQEFGPATATIVFGALGDKDYSEMLALLTPIATRFLFVPIANPRAIDPSAFLPLVPPGATCEPDVSTALRQALAHPAPILVTGSLFLVGEVLAQYSKAQG